MDISPNNSNHVYKVKDHRQCRETERNTITEFNTPNAVRDRASELKINKDINDLNNKYMYGHQTLHAGNREHTYAPPAHATFTEIDQTALCQKKVTYTKQKYYRCPLIAI